MLFANEMPMKIAVVGTGISGMLAARLLADEHDIDVFEAGDYVGGHSNTVDVEFRGRSYALDTGFMVFNDRTYPNFVRMLEALGVGWRCSDMSFSVSCERTGLEYQGSSLDGLFAQRRNAFRPGFHRMLWDIVRFNRHAVEWLESGDDETTLAEYVALGGYGKGFVDNYLIPMGAAIWSARPEVFGEFPARFILNFLHNHGLLQFRDRPRWKTIVGGARRYVEALTGPLADRIRLSSPVVSVRRHPEGVILRTSFGPAEVFDAVVMATHADQTLAILTDPTPAEREILGAFEYQRNDIVLHWDRSFLPRRPRAWASWNYRIPPEPDRPVALTYNLNRLQGHVSEEPLCETLNPTHPIAPDKVLRRMVYHHPVFTRASLAAQSRYDEINGADRTYFCGAYWAHGFHEDGVNSALAVGRSFGKDLSVLDSAPSHVQETSQRPLVREG
jgi:predicted NAD/FAD-binding protein